MKIPIILLAVALAGCSTRPVNTIKFPDRAYQYGVYGTVHVQYDVNKDGRIENIVVNGDDDGFFTKQIVNDMKHWRLEKEIVFELKVDSLKIKLPGRHGGWLLVAETRK